MKHARPRRPARAYRHDAGGRDQACSAPSARADARGRSSKSLGGAAKRDAAARCWACAARRAIRRRSEGDGAAFDSARPPPSSTSNASRTAPRARRRSARGHLLGPLALGLEQPRAARRPRRGEWRHLPAAPPRRRPSPPSRRRRASSSPARCRWPRSRSASLEHSLPLRGHRRLERLARRRPLGVRLRLERARAPRGIAPARSPRAHAPAPPPRRHHAPRRRLRLEPPTLRLRLPRLVASDRRASARRRRESSPPPPPRAAPPPPSPPPPPRAWRRVPPFFFEPPPLAERFATPAPERHRRAKHCDATTRRTLGVRPSRRRAADAPLARPPRS